MNKRAPQMWEQIIQHVDFKGRSVIDLGCGTGDFLLLALRHGAAWALGVDIDPHTARTAKETCKAGGHAALVMVEDIANLPPESEYDIGLCLGVMPYLENPVKAMAWMRASCQTSIIETPYAGDGPGPKAIVDDLDCLRFLEMFWGKPEVIGFTETDKGRRRTLWKCEHE